jgi:hypothetical protein
MPNSLAHEPRSYPKPTPPPSRRSVVAWPCFHVSSARPLTPPPPPPPCSYINLFTCSHEVPPACLWEDVVRDSGVMVMASGNPEAGREVKAQMAIRAERMVGLAACFRWRSRGQSNCELWQPFTIHLLWVQCKPSAKSARWFRFGNVHLAARRQASGS